MAARTMFDAVKVGHLGLANRFAMSAMTRLRNEPGGEYPRELNVLYYQQRASQGSLIVSEGTCPCPMGRGYIRAPGIWTDEQVEGWKSVTSAVHAKGGSILCQLMHCGRVSHSSLLPAGERPLAPSPVRMAGQIHVDGGAKADYETPRALETHEIPQVVRDFARAARRASEAGFDGVELHGGNGYLLQQFLGAPTNQRTDDYGGSVANRCRLLLEVVDACVAELGAGRVALKLQPGVTFSDLVETEEDARAQLEFLGPELAKRGLAYVCLASLNYAPYYSFLGLSEPNFKEDIWRYFRSKYSGVLMINGGLDPERAQEYVADGTADLVAFATLYIANANLPALVKAGIKEFNMRGADVKLWYGGDPADDEHGYTDWPLVEA